MDAGQAPARAEKQLERSRNLGACRVNVVKTTYACTAPLDVPLGQRFVGLRQRQRHARARVACTMRLRALLTARSSTDIERHCRPISLAMSPKDYRVRIRTPEFKQDQ